MKRLHLLFYQKSFAVASYYKSWDKTDDYVSGYIELMKYCGQNENEKIIVHKIINSWVSWIKMKLNNYELNFDIILRVLGNNELQIDVNKPMHILADRLAKEINAQYKPDLLRKIKKTIPQKDIKTPWERRRNIKDSFATSFEYSKIHNKKILVLDDIKTDGATANEIAGVLSCNGQNKLFFLALGETSKSPNSNTDLLNHLMEAKNN